MLTIMRIGDILSTKAYLGQFWVWVIPLSEAKNQVWQSQTASVEKGDAYSGSNKRNKAEA